jgi:hypothetical protein
MKNRTIWVTANKDVELTLKVHNNSMTGYHYYHHYQNLIFIGGTTEG